MDNDIGGGGPKHHVLRMRVGGDSSELLKDDEMSVTLEDEGDEEVKPKENIWLRFCAQV